MMHKGITLARAVPILHELARRGINLQRKGSEWEGPCPVCGGRDRFSVNPFEALWNCRGCQRGGDVIDLVRKDQRFCCNACKCASWRFIGGIREFEHRYGEGAVLHRAQRWAIALIGGRLGDMTDGHDLIYRRSPHCGKTQADLWFGQI
jgi:hypothetical protein